MKVFIKYVGLWLCVICLFSSCNTAQDWIDTGISSPYHDCSIMEYLRQDTSNWKLTVELIERAGLVDLFEGNDPDYKEITFFAPHSLSVLRYVWDKATGREDFPNIESMWRPLTDEEGNHPELLVRQLDPDWCRVMIMRHVVKGKHLKSSFAFRNMDYFFQDPNQDGFTELVCESGNTIRVYLEHSAYASVEDGGAIFMYLYSCDNFSMVPLSSPDVQPLNGVVHALDYKYVLGKI